MPNRRFNYETFLKVRECILSYMYDICRHSKGNFLSVTYRDIYDKCGKYCSSERQFRYYWKLVIESLRQFYVTGCRKRGRHVFTRDICEWLETYENISKLATEKLQLEKVMHCEEELRYWIGRLYSWIINSGRNSLQESPDLGDKYNMETDT